MVSATTTRAPARKGRRSAGRAVLRPMFRADLERVSELQEASRCAADPRSFGLLRAVKGARWFVGEASGGRLVGMVGAVPLGETGVLCHLTVHPDHRGNGLGTALSSRAITYLRNWGADNLRLYATPEAEGIYHSLGFEPVARRAVFRLEGGGKRPSAAAASRGSEGRRVSRLSPRDLPELCALDRRSCGADRAALILATLTTYPGPSLVARDACDRIAGYLLSSSSDDALRIGPFAAATPAVARALLAHVLPLARTSMPIEVVVPNPTRSAAREVLEEFGFRHQGADRLRMQLGETRPSHGPEQYGNTPYLAT